MTLLIPLNNSVFVPICAKKHMKNWRKTWTSWTSLPFNSATSVPGSASWPRSQLPPHSWWVMDAGMEQKPAKPLHFWNILKRIQDFNGLLELLIENSNVTSSAAFYASFSCLRCFRLHPLQVVCPAAKAHKCEVWPKWHRQHVTLTAKTWGTADSVNLCRCVY